MVIVTDVEDGGHRDAPHVHDQQVADLIRKTPRVSVWDILDHFRPFSTILDLENGSRVAIHLLIVLLVATL